MSSFPDQIELILENEREVELTPIQQMLYDTFARSYLFDKDVERAALRLGFHYTIARIKGSEILSHGFTQRRLQFLATENVSEVEERKTENYAFRSIRHNLSSNDETIRQNAAINIFRIKQMREESKRNAPAGLKSGVMVTESLDVTPDEWEVKALESQTELKNSVRD